MAFGNQLLVSGGSAPPPPVTGNNGQFMYAGTSNGELYQSFDYGATWYLRYTFGSASNVINLQCSLDGQKVIAINGSLLYLSEDAGQTFTSQSRQSFYALSSNAAWLYRTTYDRLQRSSDFGVTWSGNLTSSNQGVGSIVVTNYSGSIANLWWSGLGYTWYAGSSSFVYGYKSVFMEMSGDSGAGFSFSGTTAYRKSGFNGAYGVAPALPTTSNWLDAYYDNDASVAGAVNGTNLYVSSDNFSTATASSFNDVYKVDGCYTGTNIALYRGDGIWVSNSGLSTSIGSYTLNLVNNTITDVAVAKNAI